MACRHLRVSQPQDRRTRRRHRPARLRPDAAGRPRRPDAHRRQGLHLGRVRGPPRRPRHRAGTTSPPQRTSATRRPPAQVAAPDHRVDQRHSQDQTQPRTPRRPQPPRSPGPGPATTPRPDRRHLAQPPRRPARPAIPHRLRPLTPWICHLVAQALVPGATPGVIASRGAGTGRRWDRRGARCRRSPRGPSGSRSYSCVPGSSSLTASNTATTNGSCSAMPPRSPPSRYRSERTFGMARRPLRQSVRGRAHRCNHPRVRTDPARPRLGRPTAPAASSPPSTDSRSQRRAGSRPLVTEVASGAIAESGADPSCDGPTSASSLARLPSLQ